MTLALPGTAPRCPRCHNRHLAALPCWRSRYATTITAMVLATMGRTCWLCGKPGATTADHVTPRSMGGNDDMANMRPAHKRCNNRRQNHDPFHPDPEHQPRGVTISDRWT